MRALNFPGFMALFLNLLIFFWLYIGNLDNDVFGSTRMWQTGNMALPQTDKKKEILRLLHAGEFSQEMMPFIKI